MDNREKLARHLWKMENQVQKQRLMREADEILTLLGGALATPGEPASGEPEPSPKAWEWADGTPMKPPQEEP